MFTITPAAAKQVKAAAEQGGTEGMALRMAVRENRDGSFAYHMGFDEAADTDQRICSEGVEVVMDPSFEKYLELETKSRDRHKVRAMMEGLKKRMRNDMSPETAPAPGSTLEAGAQGESEEQK